ncbi:hypothetical protein KFL_000120360 [Klebsormidium nitens]|uniref:Uncharacterized protein n=1 Tax=Klebsormidium nitens TaxID=105231 RepID=A0A1Y1HN23_KLENI|nr:hypothetical protein KFL_000120360 [Klebsormidium nitens]|eukprot:GAQ78391.1 hypothetical protein KFL_000120360 [Klebsormidium nitens]
MAFTTRSKRDISALPATETGKNIGPGSYLSPSHYSAKPNLAPFCSSRDRGIAPPTARDSVNTRQINPSSSEELALGARDFSIGSFGGYSHPSRPSSSFAEGVSRFEDRRRSSTPGPGAYGQLSTRDWFKGIPRAQGEGRRRAVVFKRAVSAPSVPAKNQSFGYDEEESGELIMQGPPLQEGHSGISGDLPGPGEYAPRPEPSAKFTSFSRTVGHQPIVEERSASAIPGPGYYERSVDKRSEKRPQTSSAFVSKVPKAHQVAVKEERLTPGPGHYGTLGLQAERSVIRSPTPFGSSERRAYEIDDSALVSAPTIYITPGPGAYDVSSAPRGSSKKALPVIVPFASTAPRFEEFEPATPEPEAVTNSTSSPPEKKKHNGKSAGFLSTAQRGLLGDPPDSGETEARLLDSVFGALARSARETARRSPKRDKLVLVQYRDNGSKKVPVESGGQGRPGVNEGFRKPGSMFVSKLQRFSEPRQVAESPGPGEYHRDENWVRRNRQNNQGILPPRRASSAEPGFESTVARFASTRKDGVSVPGPGAYYSPSSFVEYKGAMSELHKLALSKRESLWGTSGRFADRTNSWTPGPGAYEARDPYGSVVKKTFNVTLDAPKDIT